MMWLYVVSVVAGYAETVDPFLEPDETDLFRAERQVVTVASRYAQTLEQAPSLVTVVTADDIRIMGYRNLTDVLRNIPGVYISVSKESRNLAWFRGVVSSDNNKILLLVDGVPWYDGVYTHAWIDDVIPLFHVKQIEIIKGPGSAVYGTNAYSGVINIVTKKAKDINGVQMKMATGSFARQEVGIMAGQQFENGTQFRAYARMFDMRGDGLSITPKGASNVSASNPKKSINGGVELVIKNTQIRYDFLDYTHTYFVNPQDNLWSVLLESPDEFNLNYRNDFFHVRSNISMGNLGQVSPYLYTQRYYNTSNYAYTTGYSTDENGKISLGETLVHAVKFTERYGLGLEAQMQPTANHVSVFGAGADLTYIADLQDYSFINGSGESVPTNFGAEPGSWITDVFTFAQHTWTATWWMEVTGGARLDAYNYAGSFVSPRLGVLFVPANGASIKLLYGRANRTPNAREVLVQVVPDVDGTVPFTNGNTALRPERIDTAEIDLNGKSKNLSVRTSVFFSVLQDQITKRSVQAQPGLPLGDQYYDNTGSGMVLGAEAEAQWRPAQYAVDLSYSATYAMDLVTGNLQYEFPLQMAHFRLGYQPEKNLWLNVRGDIYGKRPRVQWTEGLSNLPDGDPFSLIHLNMSYKPFHQDIWSIEGTVFNLMDSDYKTLLFVDDVNALRSDGTAKYPYDLQGEERAMYVGINAKF